jgi:hypothetical protein
LQAAAIVFAQGFGVDYGGGHGRGTPREASVATAGKEKMRKENPEKKDPPSKTRGGAPKFFTPA